MMARRVLWRVWVAAAWLWAASVGATVSVPTDLSDAAQSATVIVRGRVSDVRAFVNASGGPVFTAVTLVVSESLKGPSAAFVTFTVHGGTIGRYESRVIGAPVLAAGEDVFVFLRRASDGGLWPVGMSAGVYKVQGGAVAAPVVAGVTAPLEGPVLRGDVRRRAVPASDFAGLVRLVLADKTGRTGPVAGGAKAPGTGRGGGAR